MITQQILNITLISLILTYLISYCRENILMFITVYVFIFYLFYIIINHIERKNNNKYNDNNGNELTNGDVKQIEKINKGIEFINADSTEKEIKPIFNVQTQLGDNKYIYKDCGDACIQKLIKDDNILLGGINSESLAIIARDEYDKEDLFF